MKHLLTKLFALFAVALVMNACVEDDDFDVPEIPPVEEIQEIISEGGDNATFLNCLSEDFQSYEDNTSSFPMYENVSTLGTRLWRVDQFQGEGTITLSAFNAQGETYAYFVIPVNFDEADSFQFATQDRFWNGDPLEIKIVTNYSITDNIAEADIEDITSSFDISSGNEDAGSGPKVPSGSFDLSSYEGNGFIAFKYEGSGDGITTTIHVDDILITDNEDDSCATSGGSGDACYAENFEDYNEGDQMIANSQNITVQGSNGWAVESFSDEQYLFSSAFETGEVLENWLIQGVDFDVTESMDFETLSGFANGEVLSVMVSTDYNADSEDPSTGTWTDITDEFEISNSEDGFASNWTESGEYTFDLSGQGFVAFVYNGDSAGTTTAMEVDDIQYYTESDGDCVYDISGDGGGNDGQTSVGGENAMPMACLEEPFSDFSSNQTEFSDYENVTVVGDRFWEVREFENNQYIQNSAFNGDGEYDSWFLVNVDFDNADTFSFMTKDGFNNGDVLSVLYSTNHTVGNEIMPDDWTDVTSEFTIASGSTGGYADNFTPSGDWDLSSVSGNGFVAFRYQGDSEGTTTTMQVDDITITDNEDPDCGDTGGEETCFDEDYEAFAENDTDLDTYQNVNTVGEELWEVRAFDNNQYIQMSAFDTGAEQSAWFIMGVDFDSATGISFDTKDGFNNGDPLTVLVSTDYDEQGDPTTANWMDITSEFEIATGSSGGYADNFTPSGTYEFMESGNGYVAFKYDGSSDGITTTIQVDNVSLYGDGMCKNDLPPVNDGGGDEPTLLLSELADPENESGARFVEIYNYGSETIDLSNFALQRWTNDNADPQSPVALEGTIAPGETFVVSNNADTFETTYGFAPNMDIGTGGPADSNGDDQIAIVDSEGTIIDIFGVPGEDGSGTNHEFEDGRALRNADVMMANTTYTFSEWTIWNDTGEAGTTNEPQQAPDNFTPGEHPDDDGGSVDSEARINEFHYDNEGGDEGEFIEVRITGPQGDQPDNLGDYRVILYNGSDGNYYSDGDLDGSSATLDSFTQTCDGDNCYYVWEPSSIQNGGPDGFALVGPDGLIEFLSYEGTFEGMEGPAQGVTSTDVGVEEPGSAPIGSAIQRSEDGSTWTYTEGTNTQGAENE